MIKTIFLHIGLHKTGTSTIQDNLLLNRKSLYEMGYLYPEFVDGKTILSNHSIPFCSMFCDDPSNYHINMQRGNTTPEFFDVLHKNFVEQLTEQIRFFPGEKMIISGEDIASLNQKALQSFKDLLISLTCAEVKIIIVIVVRNPVDWVSSMVQQMIKGGTLILERNNIPWNYYQSYFENVFNSFPLVFGEDAVKYCRFEDLIQTNSDLFEGFLNLLDVDMDCHAIQHQEEEITNRSLSYESAMIINCLSRNHPRFINKQMNPLYKGALIKNLIQVPGLKFNLSTHEQQIAWNAFGEQFNNVCIKNGLLPYTFRINPEPPAANKWGIPALDMLAGIMYTMKKELVVEILKGLLSELKSYGNELSWSKRIRIFALVMWYSSYFDARSIHTKMAYIAHHAGALQFFVLAVLYKVRQRKFEKHIRNAITSYRYTSRKGNYH